MAMRLEIPSFAYDYNYAYSGTSTNIPNSSKYYPSYSSYEANTTINGENNPAFVFKAKAGVQGKGFTYYGQTSQASAEIQSNLPVFKEITHFWAQAVPDNLNAPVGLCYIQPTLTVYASEGPDPAIFIKTQTFNFGMFVGVEHNLMFACTNSSYYPPYLYDTGIDMSAYLYPSTTRNTDAYVGHTYGLIRIPENNSFGFYVDNIETKLFEITETNMLANAIEYTDQTGYWPMLVEMYNNFGGAIENVYSSGAGFYYSNTTATMNVRNQGNVYFSDWYYYVHILEPDEFNAGLNGNFSLLPAAKNYSYYGVMQNCDMLTSVVIPGSVKNIPNNFITGNSVSRVVLQNGITTISANAVVSNSPLILDVPQTAYNISANAASAPSIEIPAISYNVVERGKLFGNNVNVQQLNRYETIVGLNINNDAIPDKFFKPNNYWEAANNVPINITMLNTQANITSDENGQLVVTYKNFSANVEFDQDVDQTVHSQLVGWHTYNMNDTGFMANIFSREFPQQAHVIRSFNFINDGGFILRRLPASNLAVDIVGHVNGNFTSIPDVIDGRYIVNCIDFAPAGNAYNAGPVDYDIKVPNTINGYNYITTNRTAYPSVHVFNYPANAANIYFHDGDTVCLSINNMYTTNFYFNNINHVFIKGNLNNEHVDFNLALQTVHFDNCNEVYLSNIGAYDLVDPITNAHNIWRPTVEDVLQYAYIPYNSNIVSDDWSSYDTITFNNFRMYDREMLFYSTPANECGFINRSDLNSWFNVNLPLVNLNGYYTDEGAKQVATWRSQLVSSSMYSSTARSYACNFYNIYLPHELVLTNITGVHPTFVNAKGACNVKIRGWAAPAAQWINPDYAGQNAAPLFTAWRRVDYEDEFNIDVNVSRVILSTDDTFQRGDFTLLDAFISPLYLAEGQSNSDRMKINSININFCDDPNLSMNDKRLVDDYSYFSWRVRLRNCDIDTLRLCDNISIQLENCDINNLLFNGTVVHGFNATGCWLGRVNCDMGSIIESMTNCMQIQGCAFDQRGIQRFYYRRNGLFKTAFRDIYGLSLSMRGFVGADGSQTFGGISIEDDYMQSSYSDAGISVSVNPGGHTFETANSGSSITSIDYNGRARLSVVASYRPYNEDTDDFKAEPTEPIDITANIPELYECKFFGDFGVINLPCTMAIGRWTFGYLQEGCKVHGGVYIHNKCSVHPNAIYQRTFDPSDPTQDPSYDIWPYATDKVPIQKHFSGPIGVEVEYVNNRYTASPPSNFGSLYNEINNIKIKYDDGSEAYSDYSIWPDYGYNGSRLNRFHIAYTKSIAALIPAPYAYNGSAPNSTCIQLNESMGYTTNYMSFYDLNDAYRITAINASPIGSNALRGQIHSVGAINASKYELLINGSYNSSIGAAYNAPSSRWRQIVDTNLGKNAVVAYATSSRPRQRILISNINFLNNANNQQSLFSGGGTLGSAWWGVTDAVVLSSGRPYRMLGHRTFVSSGVTKVYMPFAHDDLNGTQKLNITGAKYMNSWSIVNEPYLYQLDFSYCSANNIRINANAVSNAPMLQYLELPPGTTYIGANAFNNTRLREVKLPTGCTVSTNAFPNDCIITYY